MTDTTYEIWVRGLVPDSVLRELGDVAVTVQPAGTVLYGSLADQAELFGLLARLRAFGLELVEVRRAPERDVG